MSATFASSLRAGRGEIRLAEPGSTDIRVRVQVPEVWDAVRFVTSPDERVLTLKVKALDALFPAANYHEDFVVKQRGWEVLDEALTLAEAGIIDGSILLLTHRRRRPVR
jgi:hypothetical protein